MMKNELNDYPIYFENEYKLPYSSQTISICSLGLNKSPKPNVKEGGSNDKSK